MLGHCQVRPLRRQLKGLKAWITGQRKDQSPGTRADIPIVQIDPAFEGVLGGPESLIKFNPLSEMSSEAVWTFLRVMVFAFFFILHHTVCSVRLLLSCMLFVGTLGPMHHDNGFSFWGTKSTMFACCMLRWVGMSGHVRTAL